MRHAGWDTFPERALTSGRPVLDVQRKVGSKCWLFSITGETSNGFRLMTPTALAAPKFEFGRETVVHLHELLPNKCTGYGRSDKAEEFCLNVLA